MDNDNIVSREKLIKEIDDGEYDLYCSRRFTSCGYISLYEMGSLENNNLYFRVICGEYPLFDIKININNEFDRLFQMKFIYYEEFDKDSVKPILDYELRRSLSDFRFWTPVNKFFLPVNCHENLDDNTRFLLLTRYAINHVLSEMYYNNKSVLSKRGIKYGEISDFSVGIESFLNYFYSEFYNNVKIDYDLFKKHIALKRDILKDKKEKASSVIRFLKSSDTYGFNTLDDMLLIDIERYFNCSVKLLDLDEQALEEYKKLKDLKRERILDYLKVNK